MSTISLRLPRSVHEKVRLLAERDEISINQFITLALAEKIAALEAAEYLQQRAVRADRASYLAVLKKAPDVEPDEADRLR